MVFKIVAGVSWLLLLIAVIRLSGELSKSQLEIEDLNGRLKSATQEAAPDEAAVAAQAKAQTELATLKETLSTMNGKMELLQKHSAQEQERVLQEAANQRATLLASFAKPLSRIGLSREELETLLEDLPAEDRLRLLQQIAVAEQTTPPETDKPTGTEPKPTVPSTREMPEEEAPLVPNTDPVDREAQVAAESTVAERPATGEAPRKDVPKVATYTVKSGDNLTRIARKFDVNLAQLMKLNGISNANMLRIGQVLKIPQN